MSMSMEETINFYRKQIDFAKWQVEWCSGQIKWCGKIIKQERYDFGLSIYGEKMKKARNKYYKERSYWRHQINEYEKKILGIDTYINV